MADLTPATRAVLDAFASAPINSRSGSRLAIAAALRAAADQMRTHHSKTFLYSIADYWKLQSIADELENVQ